VDICSSGPKTRVCPTAPDQDTDGVQNSMTRGERIRAAARTIRTPRSASWIADETDVSVKTAQKYLEQLVEDNVLLKTHQGDQTLYCVDQLMATYREVARLQREHDRTELTSALESMTYPNHRLESIVRGWDAGRATSKHRRLWGLNRDWGPTWGC
jgi:hypothetical protein